MQSEEVTGHADGMSDQASSQFGFGPPEAVDPVLLSEARARAREGSDAQVLARWLIESGCSPIPAIKILREVAGLSLAEAKVVVDGALPDAVRAATESLRDNVESAMRELPEP